MQPAPPPDFAQFDLADELTLDPAVWAANIDALRALAPEFADALEAVTIPQDWYPARGLDDSPTWQIRPAGAPPRWLGNSALPQRRAASLLKDYDPGEKNPALVALGAGAALAWLVKNLPPHRAVYVFESQWSVWAAALRLYDISNAIRGRRCICLCPDREEQDLLDVVRNHPGLLPPGDLLLPRLATPHRIAEVQHRCESANRTVLRERAAAFSEAAGQLEAMPGNNDDQPRLAVLSLNPHPPTHNMAAYIERAGRRLGWPTTLCQVSDPLNVHPLVHCLALAKIRPTLTICANHSPAAFPVRLPGTQCTWLPEEPALGSRLADDGVLYLAASPTVAAAARAAGLPDKALVPWFWACEPPDDEPSEVVADDMAVLIADRRELEPEHYQIRSSSHKRLWQQLINTCEKHWETPRLAAPEKLLVQAERDCGVGLTDPQLRESLLRLIRHVLIPGVIVDQIAHAMASCDLRVHVIGHGWEDHMPRGWTWATRSVLAAAPDTIAPRPCACICAGRVDPLGPALLYAAVRGWPIAMHTVDRGGLSHALGDVLRPGQHIEPFANANELRATLQPGTKQDTLRRCAVRAAEHLRTYHTYEQRLRDLPREIAGRA